MSDKYTESLTNHIVTFDKCTIIIKNVPCLECRETGEKFYTNDVMSRIEKIIEKAKEIAGEVFITDYADTNVA